MIIARLVTELRCYLPERADPAWARLRHLGARRQRLVGEATGLGLQIRDVLECAWPAPLTAASVPMRSKSWLAAMTVALNRIGATGDLTAIRRWGWVRFAAAVQRELAIDGSRWYSPIVRAVFDAATDPAKAEIGVRAQRSGAFERVAFAIADLVRVRADIAVVEARMVGVLDQLGLTALVTSIPGLTAVGAATILAETGDLRRFDSGRAVVKHAGLCPRDNASGGYQGRTGISGRGRPVLRLVAWRAVFPAIQHNPVFAARHAHLTGRAERPLADTQARVAIAGALLRQLHAIVTTGIAWDPAIAAGQTRPTATAGAAAA